jgi:hypothetical protein
VLRIKWLDGVLNPLVPPGGVAQKRNYYSLWRIGLLRLAVRGDSGRVLDSEAKKKLVSNPQWNERVCSPQSWEYLQSLVMSFCAFTSFLSQKSHP